MGRILLTGKTGQVGYELHRSLQGLGEIIALDRSQMDLANLDQVRAVIRALRPTLIVNPAAYTAVDRAESEPALAMRINADAPAVMAQEARKIGAALIHFSTDYVFDGTKTTAYVEADPTCPINVYGRSKLAGEHAIEAAGIPHLIFRTSWVYGKIGKNFLLTVLRLAQEHDELRIVSDQHGAPTWSRTIADSTAHVVAQLGATTQGNERWREVSGLYHLTAQGSTSWHGFAQAILAQASLGGKVTVTAIAADAYALAARRPKNSVLSSARFIATFNGLPTWADALELCTR